MEMIFHSHANKTHFHKKGCALGLILEVRVFGTSEVVYSSYFSLLFTRLLCLNDFNKSPPFLTSAIKLSRENYALFITLLPTE